MKKILTLLSLAVFMTLSFVVLADNGNTEKKADNFDEYIEDVKKILPEFAKFGTRAGNDIQLLDKNGKNIGLLHVAPKGVERVEGFNGYINVAVVTLEGKIHGVAIGANEETPRWLEKVRKAGFLNLWNGKTFKEASKLKIDSVTGATWSSDAIKGEVDSIINQ